MLCGWPAHGCGCRKKCTRASGFVRGTRANGFLVFFLEPKKYKKIWNDPDPKKLRIEDAGHHLFVEGFSLQKVGGHLTLTLTIISWRWPPPFCSDRCFFYMEAMDFVEKRSSYLEKASHFIEKKRFVVQNAGVQPLLWNFNGDCKAI